MLREAEVLVSNANNLLALVEQNEPERAYLARAVLDDTVRAYALLASGRASESVARRSIAALYERAIVMSRALNNPVQ